MSDWEIVEDQPPTSDWQVVSEPQTMMQVRPQESFGQSLSMAPLRIGSDLAQGAMRGIQSLPGYFEKGKTEIPGLFSTLKQHPGSALKQGVAGLAELGQNVFNMPHDIVNYLSGRLNLVPKNINQAVQMGRMPEDTEQMINQAFGQPQQPGEALTRGLGRNALNLIGGGAAAKVLNPMNLTAKNIANNILKTEKNQIKTHNKLYNNIWDEAQKSGFNSVPYDSNLMGNYSGLINKYYPGKSTKALNDFMKNPTLEAAQKAQSDLGNLRRSLEEKSRTTPLLDTEKSLYDAISNAEKHIEGNMFKNNLGQVNQGLKNKYDMVTKSYRENVVPYKYNKNIQAYKNKEMLPKELVNALSRGEFAAKKGSSHPALKIRNAILPSATGIGLFGGADYLYNQFFGHRSMDQENQ